MALRGLITVMVNIMISTPCIYCMSTMKNVHKMMYTVSWYVPGEMTNNLTMFTTTVNYGIHFFY